MKKILNRKGVFVKALSVWSAFATVATTAAPAFAGTAVLGGSAELAQLTRVTMDRNDANAAVFSSTAASGVLDWTKFNVGSGQSVTFDGAATTFFNLVDGAAGKSQIDGIINGNGSVWVINPAGIAFGAGSSVNVGGLFAAAAGNLENADALRDGTATLPAFSSFAGEVEANKGTFVADQIALMGGKVSVAGEADFSGAFKVDVGAGDHLIVDDVGGGMVSIDLSQFADVANDVLDISGLDAGDALVDVVANGNVKATGDIQAGRLQVKAANDVDLAADVTTSMGEVTVGSLNKGDVNLSGEVCAADAVNIMANDGLVRIEETGYVKSENAGISILAGVGAGALGSVEVAGTVGLDGGDENIVIAAGQDSAPGGGTGLGSIDVSGNIYNYGSGSVMLSAGKSGTVSSGVTYGYVIPGDIRIEEGASIRTEVGDVVAAATRNVEVSGQVSSKGALSIMAGTGVDGGVSIAGEACAMGATIISAGVGKSPVSGSAVMNGGSVSIQNGGGVKTDGTLQVVAAKDVSVNGEVFAKQIQVAAMENFSVGSGGRIQAGDGGLRVSADADVSLSQSQVVSDGFTDIEAGRDMTLGGAELTSGLGTTLSASHAKIDGRVQSQGYVEIMADDSIEICDGAAVKTDGEDGSVILQAGVVTYDSDERVGVTGGDIFVGETAVVAADGKGGYVSVHALNGAVDVKGSLIADNEGAIDVTTGFAEKGGVCGPETQPAALNNGGDVNIGASSTVAAQDVWITSLGGKVDVQGRVAGTGCVSLSGDGVTSSGTIDVKRGKLEVYGHRGDINLYDKASGVVYAGDIILVAEGNVYADNPNNKIGKVTEAKAGSGKVLRINLGGGGDDPEEVEIGNIVSDTAYLRSEKGTIKVVGDITAPDLVVLETEGGDIIVMEDCTVTATGSGAVVRLKAGRDIVSDGNLVADGGVELSAKNEITVNNADAITLNSAVSENGSVSVATENGDIVIAPNARVAAAGEGGSVILKAGTLASGEGSVLVGENATLQAQDTVLAIAGYGKLKASGALEGGDVPALKSALKAAGFLLANSTSSFVEIGDRATVIAGRLISLEGKVSVISSGTINAANAKLEVVAHDGDINLYTPTEDRADAGRVIAGRADFVAAGDGNINVNNGDNAIAELGRVLADRQSDIEINLGNENGGEVAIVTAEDLVGGMAIEDGTMLIVGDITSPDMVFFQSVSGDVIVMEGVTVKVVDRGNGAALMVSAGRSARIDGTLDSDGGVAVVSSGISGGTTVGETGAIRAGEASIAALQAKGFVQIDGAVDSKGEVDIDAGGDVSVDTEGSVTADYWTYVGASAPVGGDVQIDGRVDSRGLGVYAIGSIGTGESSEIVASQVELQSYGGGMTLKGGMTADIAELSARDDIELGDMTINQRYEFAPDMFVSLGVVSSQGGITVRDGAKIDATRGDSVVRLTALGADASRTGIDVNGDVTAGQVVLNTSGDFGVAEGAKVTAKAATVASAEEDAILALAGGDAMVAGALEAENGTICVLANGEVAVGGSMSAGMDVAVQSLTSGDVTVAGSVAAGGLALVTAANGSVSVDGIVEGKADVMVESYDGGVSVRGKVVSDDMAFVAAKNGSITVDGTVDGKGAAMLDAANGGITVNGVVKSDGMAEGMAVLQTAGAGDVVLGRNAEVKGALGVVVKTENGDLIQRSAPVVDASKKGYAQSESLRPAISAGNVILDVAGDVKGDNGGSVTVDGTLAGIVSGDAKIAVGNGHDLVGGKKQDAAKVVEGGSGLFSVDLSALGENSAMLVGGNLSLYTAGGIGSYTTFEAGGDASLSAASFGDMSYLQSGGTLTINNVGRPSHPQIAYFESVNGREPKINNQPNDTVIFIDGRLAGGNLNILNKFGADEAFMVETPELKSKQGIFGNPPFLHSDLDVANPMEVCAIDYLIQEIPRLTLSSDFPAEVDRNVEAVGLSQKDVYWFGQNGAGEEPGSGVEPDENTVETDEDAEPPAEKTVAMVR